MVSDPYRDHQHIINRFMQKVTTDENIMNCWNWTGAFCKKGGPQFFLFGRPHTAQRVSYMILAQNIHDELGRGRVFRTCKNKKCVYPVHLQIRVFAAHKLSKLSLDPTDSAQIKAHIPLNDTVTIPRRAPLILTRQNQIDLVVTMHAKGKDLTEISQFLKVPRHTIILTLASKLFDPFEHMDLGPIHSPERYSDPTQPKPPQPLVKGEKKVPRWLQ